MTTDQTRPPGGHTHCDHVHHRENALPRRQFIGAVAALAGMALGPRLWLPGLAEAAPAAGSDPKPIPGGSTVPQVGFFHQYPLTSGLPGTATVQSGAGDPSLITDFTGKIGVADIASGTGKGTSNGQTENLLWKADLRFMDGDYLGVDGNRYSGTFAFI
jgi:hypothetical protein